MKIKKLSILIPTYNEAKTITTILNKIIEVELIENIEKEIIIVNDCSEDNTIEAIDFFKERHPTHPVILLNHNINLGKGASLHTGIQKATGDYLIIQDADLEYDPNEYNLLLKPACDGFADVVYGSRFMGGNAHRVLFFWHSIGNKFLTFVCNALTNLNLTDMETGYKLTSSNNYT